MKKYFIKRGELRDKHYNDDLKLLQENFRTTGTTLWARISESEEEAAVRRMKVLDVWDKQVSPKLLYRIGTETHANFADRLSPPPPVREVQLDWDTGEELPQIYTWRSVCGLWIASIVPETVHMTQKDDKFAASIYQGTTTSGPTKEFAMSNLAAIQAMLKKS